MIDAVNDAEGVRMALEEIFEEDYVRSRIEDQLKGASEETRRRLEMQVPVRTLSPGYYEFSLHLLRLEDQRKAGISLDPRTLASFEAAGLLVLARARSAFESRHPACSVCGARQQNRFGVECHACGTKFARKKR